MPGPRVVDGDAPAGARRCIRTASSEDEAVALDGDARLHGDSVTEHRRYPTRIVCLTEETTETLYLLGQGDRIVGVSGYTVRPPEARLKPKVSAFINAKFDKIEALRAGPRAGVLRPAGRPRARSWCGAA